MPQQSLFLGQEQVESLPPRAVPSPPQDDGAAEPAPADTDIEALGSIRPGESDDSTGQAEETNDPSSSTDEIEEDTSTDSETASDDDEASETGDEE